MHVLNATIGGAENEQHPIDLQQTPADIVFLSAADSDLSTLANAYSSLKISSTLRLANLTHLQHPMSVDMHLEACAVKSKLVIARVLGGVEYWKYGLESYAHRLEAAGIAFAALSGDDKFDEALWRLSNIKHKDWLNLWGYLLEGGATNAVNFLLYAEAINKGSDIFPPDPVPLLRAGVYWPDIGTTDIVHIQNYWHKQAPVVAIIFYRALVQAADLAPIIGLIKAIRKRGLNPLPIFVSSLKDPLSAAIIQNLFCTATPSAILNCTGFAVGTPQQQDADLNNPLTLPQANAAVIFQVVLAASNQQTWQDNLSGLNARDIAMNVALPEVDGRILTRAISFKDQDFFDEKTQCSISRYRACANRIAFVVDLAANWIKLRYTPFAKKKIALILANYPNKDGRLANGVGLDVPQSTLHIMRLLAKVGVEIKNLPNSATDLMRIIGKAPTNALDDRIERKGGQLLSLKCYKKIYQQLPKKLRNKIEARWGLAKYDPLVSNNNFILSIHNFGNVCVCVQPARGYNIDPKNTYHSPDLVMPHNYLAFYFWLRKVYQVDALVHMGKHGNVEWLPGKALALSRECCPEAALGAAAHIYPFIVNDPGEGTQAKRRTSAVIIDHLTPPMTRAETYGALRDLEALLDEYYEARGFDARRADYLKKQIVALSTTSGLAEDVGLSPNSDNCDLTSLDAYLCDLKEAQIRDGLHIFTQSPTNRLERDLVQSLVRVPRNGGIGGDASLQRAISHDLKLNFDPLNCDMATPWQGERPAVLTNMSSDIWRTYGDTVERIELLCAALLDGYPAADWPQTLAVLQAIDKQVRPLVRDSGPMEYKGFLTALSGCFVPPSPSGAPTRGRLDVLPTGRNFYSVDSRAIPTPSAWDLGWKSANLLLERHLQDYGEWPRALLLTAWGSANMRTGGDDIAQALALMGVKPRWDGANRRVVGFEIIPISVLDRPRVDVTLRVSGFFRDAFPAQIALVDSAVRAIMAQDESDDMNPAAAQLRKEKTAKTIESAQFRVFSAKPGAYGAGLQTMIDEHLWKDKSDLADVYLEWGGYAYGAQTEGIRARDAFEQRLHHVDAIVQNQDNREHDILDSDDYYQFEGGAAAAVYMLQSEHKPIYHNDHSRVERPLIRRLDDEIGRVIHSRVVNPKWIAGVMRHGYKGAFEMAATLDYLFAFAATTCAVKNHHFDLVEAAFIKDTKTRKFIKEHNPSALREMAQRFNEAIERGLWKPKSNSVHRRLESLM